MRGEADLEALLGRQPAEGVAAAEAVARGGDAGDVLHRLQVVDAGGDEGVGLLGRRGGEEDLQLRGRHLVQVERRRRAVEQVRRHDEVARAPEAVREEPVLEQLDAVHVGQVEHGLVRGFARDV